MHPEAQKRHNKPEYVQFTSRSEMINSLLLLSLCGVRWLMVHSDV